MKIMKAIKQDIPNIMNLIKEVVKHMMSQEIYQWNEDYPNLEVINNDIHNKDLYVIKNEKDCLGIIVINEEQSPEYKDINWKDHSEKVLVIHRLAVHPKYQGQGIARKLMDFAESYAGENGYMSIRLDCYSGNPRLNKVYLKRGYESRGQVYFPMREMPFNCYEKILKED